MAKNQPKVPGEASDQPDSGAPEQPGGEDLNQPAAGEPGNSEGETVTISKADYEQIMDRLNRLETAQPARGRSNQGGELPDQKDIDVSKLKSPVLTKQGWVVPDSFGTHQNAPK